MKKYIILLLFSVGSFAQFNPTTWYNFGGREVKVNTYIGGIGGSINTKELLASKLGIPAYRIKKFSVVGSDIECAIIGNYVLGAGAFYNSLITSSSPTYYYDVGKLCTEIGNDAFYNSFNTGLFYFPAVTKVGVGQFYHQNSPDSVIANRLIYLPLCTNFAGLSTVSDNQTFNTTVITHKLIINSFNQTSNAGGVNATINYGVTAKGLIAEYVSGDVYTLAYLKTIIP